MTTFGFKSVCYFSRRKKEKQLTNSDYNLHSFLQGVDWPEVERTCFSEWSHPADSELGVQIVKDLHRTGCSLFCGEDGQENQALLKRVLLAYARWNKAVGEYNLNIYWHCFIIHGCSLNELLYSLWEFKSFLACKP